MSLMMLCNVFYLWVEYYGTIPWRSHETIILVIIFLINIITNTYIDCAFQRTYSLYRVGYLNLYKHIFLKSIPKWRWCDIDALLNDHPEKAAYGENWKVWERFLTVIIIAGRHWRNSKKSLVKLMTHELDEFDETKISSILDTCVYHRPA